jgi:hypothetical protein
VDINDLINAAANKHGPSNIAIGRISGLPSACMGGILIIYNKQKKALKDLLIIAIFLKAEH